MGGEYYGRLSRSPSDFVPCGFNQPINRTDLPASPHPWAGYGQR